MHMPFSNIISKGIQCIAIGVVGSSVLMFLGWYAYSSFISTNIYSVQKTSQILSYDSYSNANETYVIYYFGASTCGVCERPEVISAIDSVRFGFSEIHDDYPVKYVMVVMDKTIIDGLAFVDKYHWWDELSIGGFYRNESVLNTLVYQPQPGVPHLIVYRDVFREIEFGIRERISRHQITSVVGGDRIVDWVARGYPLDQ